MKVGGVANIQHYLDDFLLIGPGGSDKCQTDLTQCLALCAQLGVPVAHEKTAGLSTQLTFLGFELDAEKLELRLPETKLLRLREALSLWMKHKTATKRDLLGLVGLLQHCCQAIVHGWPFLRRLIDKLTQSQNSTITLSYQSGKGMTCNGGSNC